jgi:hypothetical protein
MRGTAYATRGLLDAVEQRWRNRERSPCHAEGEPGLIMVLEGRRKNNASQARRRREVGEEDREGGAMGSSSR